MLNSNLVGHQMPLSNGSMIDVNSGIFSQFDPSSKIRSELQGLIADQKINNSPLYSYDAWKIISDDESIDSVSFINDIMKIMNENPKLYNALANDKYES